MWRVLSKICHLTDSNICEIKIYRSFDLVLNQPAVELNRSWKDELEHDFNRNFFFIFDFISWKSIIVFMLKYVSLWVFDNSRWILFQKTRISNRHYENWRNNKAYVYWFSCYHNLDKFLPIFQHFFVIINHFFSLFAHFSKFFKPNFR